MPSPSLPAPRGLTTPHPDPESSGADDFCQKLLKNGFRTSDVETLLSVGIQNEGDLMTFVGSGDHAMLASFPAVHYKVERYYWANRRKGWQAKPATPKPTIGKRHSSVGRQAQGGAGAVALGGAAGGVTPTSPRRWDAHFDPWERSSDAYGEHLRGGRQWPLAQASPRNLTQEAVGWEPPKGWAQDCSPTLDPALLMCKLSPKNNVFHSPLDFAAMRSPRRAPSPTRSITPPKK
eukprot:Sspe_Gene.74738::Locus_46703_Transcript_1_1_Confidence_1.000_Length_846::g.74738::m.74738